MKIDLNYVEVDNACKKLFGNKDVNIEVVYDYVPKHSKDLNLDDFCKLYLVVGIFEFFVPNRSGRFFFHLVQLC